MDKSTSAKIKELRKEIKKYKKDGNVNMVIRLKVVIAYLSEQPINTIASCYDISSKTIKRWIAIFESKGIDSLPPKSSSGRPPKLDMDKLNQLRETINEDNQRVWVARHVHNLVITLFNVAYSVKYLPTLLRKINLSFHKAVHYLVKKNEEKHERLSSTNQ